ncbi:hypothetical protein B6U96_13055 [Archaeoglobales archaeon ex4484_92]|nr:MAG: hypothetical protein B6U96_13055 [Archaeoglobales archaeon ex4484_92]
MHEKYKVKFEYSSEVGEKLVTRSKCPIYKLYPIWCEEACISFIESFAREIVGGIKVRRIEKQPESEFCTFEFVI